MVSSNVSICDPASVVAPVARGRGVAARPGSGMATTYRVIVGIDYAGKRVEPGAIVSDLPPKSVAWLTAQGIIEKASGEPAPEPTPVKTKQREPQSPSKGDQ
jgi:hypothetical protein